LPWKLSMGCLMAKWEKNPNSIDKSIVLSLSWNLININWIAVEQGDLMWFALGEIRCGGRRQTSRRE
jgi:hypothetical protein